MKRALLFAFVLLGILATSVYAAGVGVNINWGAGCWSDGTPLANKTFNCTTNSGSEIITCSFGISAAQPGFLGIELTLEGMTEEATVPPWWQMDEGECRASAISASEDFTSSPAVGCTDPWGNQALGGVAGYFDNVTTSTSTWLPGLNHEHCLLAFALNADSPSPLDVGPEYYAARMIITHAKTVGTGACDGCTVPNIWGLYSLKVASLGLAEMLFEPLPGGNQCLTWQGSSISCHLVPTRNVTWGQVKSLYR